MLNNFIFFLDNTKNIVAKNHVLQGYNAIYVSYICKIIKKKES